MIGPFNIFDARVYLSQAVVDIARAQRRASGDAERQGREVRHHDRARPGRAGDRQPLPGVGRDGEPRRDDARPDGNGRPAAETGAGPQGAGLVAGIDVLRAQVQLQTQRQRVIAAENDYDKSKLQLARAIGLPVGQPLTLTDKIPYAPMPVPPLEQVLPKALESRADYLAAKSLVEAARSVQARGRRHADAVAARGRRFRCHRTDLRDRAQHLHGRRQRSRPDLRGRARQRAARRGRLGPAPAPGGARGLARPHRVRDPIGAARPETRRISRSRRRRPTCSWPPRR